MISFAIHEDKKVLPRPGLPQKSKLFSSGLSKFSINLSHSSLIFIIFSLGEIAELYLSGSGVSA